MNFASLYTVVAVCAFAGCTAGEVRAESERAADKGIFDLELFSLSKHAEDAFDAPAAVYVITSEDIRRSGATVLPEVLRMVPGLQVARQGSNKWAVGSRGFDFQFTNDLLVLIDGRTIYTPQFSGVVWDDHNIPLENIEKIEVIRGPGATVWGANAVNGVINIITKNAEATQGNSISAFTSTNDDHTLSVRHGGKIDGDGYYRVHAKRSLWGSFDTVSGADANDAWQDNQLGFRTDWGTSKDKKIMVEGDIRRGIANNYFVNLPTLVSPFTTYDPHPKKFVGANIVTKIDQVISDTSRSTTQFYIDYIADHTGIVDRNGTTFDFDYQRVSDMNTRHQLTWGTGYRYIIDNITPDDVILNYRVHNRRNSLFSGFLQDKIGLVPDTVYLTAGSKIEHNDYTGFEFEPSVKLSYFPDDKQTVWSSVTRAIRTPSRGESDAVLRLVGTAGGYIARLGDPNYDSEKLIAYELGYRVRPSDTVVLEATAFYNDYDELRTFDAGVIPAFGDVITPLVATNNGTGETEGIELNAKWQVNEKWRLQGSYTFLNMDLHLTHGSTDTTFPPLEGQAPKNQFGIQSFYNILPSVEWDTNFYFVDNLPGVSPNGIDAYTRVDTRLGWRPNEQIEVSLLANNLLISKHAEFQQSLFAPQTKIPRTVFLMINVEF